MNIGDKIQRYAQLLMNKKTTLDYVHSKTDESKKEEEIEQINKFYEKELQNENVDISEFITTLKEKLDTLATVREEFITSIKVNPDPFTDQDINEFVDKCVMLRCYIDQAFEKQIEDTLPKQDVINMMHSIQLQPSYMDLLEKFYPEHISSMDIINMYKQRQSV